MKITKNNIKDIFKVSKKADQETMEGQWYEYIRNFFVDSSWRWASDEPALTPAQFTQEITELLEVMPTIELRISSVWNFQLNIGCYRFLWKEEVQEAKLKHETRIKYTDNWYFIRVYDTKIVQVEKVKNYWNYYLYITLDAGGHFTGLTRDRMNEFTPPSMKVRKSWDKFKVELLKNNVVMWWTYTEKVTMRGKTTFVMEYDWETKPIFPITEKAPFAQEFK